MATRTTIKDLEYFVSLINEKIGNKEYGIGHYMLGQAAPRPPCNSQEPKTGANPTRANCKNVTPTARPWAYNTRAERYIMDITLEKYNVETNHGVIVIVGTDESDAMVMAEKAGFKTFSATIAVEEKKPEIDSYLTWCKKMGIEPC